MAMTEESIRLGHPWTSSLAKTVMTAPKGARDTSSVVLWAVQLPATVDVPALDSCAWTRHGDDAWTTTVNGTDYVMEPATSSSPSYVVDDSSMLPIKMSMIVRMAIDEDNLGKEERRQPPSPDRKKKKKKKSVH